MTSPKLRGGLSAARWVGAVLVVLVLFVVLAAAERVYVYEVESDVEIAEDVPHVPGICWRFGEQLLVVWVPRDVKPGIILFTNKTAPIPLYDRTYFLLVVPADAQPSQRAEAEAFLKTPDGTYPVVFRKPDGGIIDITAHSIEEALTILKQMGLQPEYRGKAELRTDKKDHLDAGRETAAPAIPRRPSVGSTFDVYGGLYFRETPVTKTGLVIIPVHGTESACINLPYAAYVGYDAKSFALGTLIRGGAVDADLIVEVYKIEFGGNCTFLGSRRFVLANRTIYLVDLINSTTSVDRLAVFVMLDVRSFSGQPRVGVNASLIYTRTYRYGFEVGEFAARAAGGFVVHREVRRIVIGPYVAYDGYVAQTASSSLTLTLATEPVNGVCKDLRVRFTINGRSSSGTYTYSGRHLGLCIYDVYLPYIWEQSFQTEYFYAKAFGGGLSWVLDIEYTDGSTPYIVAMFLKNADAFRYWRWAEQWKTTPGAIDAVWAKPFLSSAFELYATPTEPIPPPGIYHGVVTVRADSVGQMFRARLSISGRYTYPGLDRVVYMKKAEVDIAMPLSVWGLYAVGYYLDDLLSSVAPRGWVREAFDVKRVVDCILMLAGVVGRVSGLLGFATGEGLKSAGDSVMVQTLDYYTARIIYRRGWYATVASDTIMVPLMIPSLYGRDTPTELEITRICLDNICTNPSLKAYVQPDRGYGGIIQAILKNWMCRGQVIDTATCEILMR
ncbi:MAG: hypothetical protein ACO2PN_18875 [Pyrobaculum sp.]